MININKGFILNGQEYYYDDLIKNDFEYVKNIVFEVENVVGSMAEQKQKYLIEVKENLRDQDIPWFLKIKAALRLMMFARQKLTYIIKHWANIRHEEKPRKKNIEKYFIDVCKEELEENDFKEIMDEAKRRRDEDSDE